MNIQLLAGSRAVRRTNNTEPANLFANSGFDSAASWGAGANWALGGGKAVVTGGVGAGAGDLHQPPTANGGLVVGKQYRLSIKVDAFSRTGAGGIRILTFSGQNYQNGIGIVQVGLFEQTFTCQNATEDYYFRAEDCSAEIDYIRLEEVL